MKEEYKYNVAFNKVMCPCIYKENEFIAQFGSGVKNKQLDDLLRANICSNALNEINESLLVTNMPISKTVYTLKTLKKDIEMAFTGQWDNSSSIEGFEAMINTINKALKYFK